MPDEPTSNSDSGGYPPSTDLISTKPGKNKIALGESFSQLSGILGIAADSDVSLTEARRSLHEFQENQTQYINPKSCQEVDCVEAVGAWSKRLNSIAPKIDFNNFLKPSEIEGIKDSQASLRLVSIAEDFALISRYCRTLESCEIAINSSDFGIEFVFTYHGPCSSLDSRKLEDRSLNMVLAKSLRENSLRPWINCSSESAELRVIVLKPNARLGISPRD